ncbi:MAG: SGNH/GDSL hydrolase family protein [Cyclobacteriaceae bacterium]
MIPLLKFQISVFLLVVYSLASCSEPEEPARAKPVVPVPVPNPVGEIQVDCDSKREDDSTIRILFIGNSLTYTNDLPALVEKEGNAAGKSVVSDALAFPNYALEDHWVDGKMQKKICAGNYDFVVVQQGPSSQSDGRVSLLDYGQLIKDICTSRGTELAFYMVWPAKNYYHTFDGVISNYTEAASATNSILIPVGAAFKAYGDQGEYLFYGPDDFHPSPEGSRLAARLIYSTLVN